MTNDTDHRVGPPGRGPSKPRWRRWLRRVALGVAIVVGLVVAIVLTVVHSLDRPAIKRRIAAAVHKATGLDVDYRTVTVAILSGASVDGIVVQSPKEVRDATPDLVRIGRIDAAWSLASLRGAGPVLERVTIRDVALAVVVDEKGRTSFDAIGPATPAPSAPPTPATPVSQLLAQALASPPPAGAVELSNVSAVVLETRERRVVGKTTLSGLGAHVGVAPTTGGWRVRAELGSAKEPLDLRLAREEEHKPWTARLHLAVSADAAPSALAASVDLDVLEQSVAKEIPLGRVLHAAAHAAFDPKGGRTAVTLDGVDLAAGAGRLSDGSIELPDEGAPIVQHAQGDVDLAKVLALDVAGLAPVHLATGQLHYAVDGLVLEPVPRVTDAGGVTVAMKLSGASVHAGTLESTLDAADVTLRARSLAKGRVDVDGAIAIPSADARNGDASEKVRGLALEVRGSEGEDGALDGTVTLHVNEAIVAGVEARKADVGVRLGGVHVDPKAPLATRGDVTVSFDAASVDARAGRSRVAATGLHAAAHATLAGREPYGGTAEVHASRLSIAGAAATLVDAPLDVHAAVDGARPDVEHLIASTGAARVEASVGDVTLSVSATKERDAADYTLHAAARTLTALRALLPADLAHAAPWAEMAVDVSSHGRATRLASAAPLLDERTELHVTHPAFDPASARSLALVMSTKGDVTRHAVHADLRLDDLSISGTPPKSDHVVLSGSFDRAAESLHADVALDGRADAKVVATLGFDRGKRAVTYDVDGHLAHLGAIAALLPPRATGGVDLNDLDVDVGARGALLGVVADVSRAGAVVLEPNPRATFAVLGALDVKAARVHWSGGAQDVEVPALAWHAYLSAPEGKRVLRGSLSVDGARVASGMHTFELEGVKDAMTLTVSGDLANPVAQVEEHLSVQAVKQDAAPYAVGGASLAVEASRDKDGIIRVPKLDFTNAASGTTLSLSGGVDLGEARHRMSMRGKVEQDLSLLAGLPEVFAGTGKVSFNLSVESADMAIFHAQTDVHLQDVSVRLPKAGVAVEGVQGELPLTIALAADAHGLTLLRNARISPYSLLRFTDQHPMLSRSSYLSIARITAPFVSIAPLAGNFSVEDNIVSITQFDMGVRGGRITGQCVFDFDGYSSTLGVHVRATDLLSSHGERFDGNAALVISAGERTVEGRADIVRIGKRHLLDLLDVQDPLRVDPEMNLVRKSLSFGYPDQVRLTFDHGFASAHITFGGLARLVSVADVRGRPMGPIIDKFLGPLLPK